MGSNGFRFIHPAKTKGWETLKCPTHLNLIHVVHTIHSSYLLKSGKAMASAFMCLCLCLFLFLHLSTSTAEDPIPAPWPEQFHSVLLLNRSGSLRKQDLWYDWPNGRNFNIIQYQLDVLKYDLEWNNGTTFLYTLDPFNHTCKVTQYDVGIPRPNWLDGANYLGQQYADNFLCNVWEKVGFIWYFEDVLTKRPVKWIFYDG